MRPKVLCAETTWRGKAVGDCPNRAKVMAKMPGETLWTPLCGTHANTDRWANYIDMQWRDMDGNDLPNLPSRIDKPV